MEGLTQELTIEILFDRLAVKMQQAEFRIQHRVNEDWHKTHKLEGMYSVGCGCTFCRILHQYVVTKISAHRLRRRLDKYDYMCRPYDNPVGYAQLKQLEKEWPRLRELAHQIKAEAGL